MMTHGDIIMTNDYTMITNNHILMPYKACSNYNMRHITPGCINITTIINEYHIYGRLFLKQKFLHERQNLNFEELKFRRLQISKNSVLN